MSIARTGRQEISPTRALAGPRRPVRVVLVTGHGTRGAPPQSIVIRRGLQELGYEIRTLGEADSAMGRFLSVALGFGAIARADVVIVDVFGARAFVYEALALGFARLFGKRSIGVLRGGWIPAFMGRWPRVVPSVLRWATALYAPHAYLEAELSRLGVAVTGTLPNVVRLEQYRYRERTDPKPRFLYLRGTHPIYDPEMTLRAFALVQRRHPSASLTFAGGGPLTRVREVARELGLRHVRFVGLVPKDSIPRLADKHDIYIQSNRVENMPVTVLEMWASGVPVVGTDVGGMSYLVEDGVNGLLVSPGDDEALAGACLRLLSEPGLGARLAAAGRRKVESLTWEHVRDRWSEALGLSRPVASDTVSFP